MQNKILFKKINGNFNIEFQNFKYSFDSEDHLFTFFARRSSNIKNKTQSFVCLAKLVEAESDITMDLTELFWYNELGEYPEIDNDFLFSKMISKYDKELNTDDSYENFILKKLFETIKMIIRYDFMTSDNNGTLYSISADSMFCRFISKELKEALYDVDDYIVKNN